MRAGVRHQAIGQELAQAPALVRVFDDDGGLGRVARGRIDRRVARDADDELLAGQLAFTCGHDRHLLLVVHRRQSLGLPIR